MATDEPLGGNTETPRASDSKTGMGQELALVVHQSFNLLDDGVHGDDDDFKLMEQEKLAMVVHQQPTEEDAGQADFFPLMMVRPESEETAQERRPAFRYDQRPEITKTYTRRTRPAGSKPGKSKIEQKPALFDSRSSRFTKGDKHNDIVRPTPTRKRRRPAGSKSAKRKKDKNGVCQPEVYIVRENNFTTTDGAQRVTRVSSKASDDDKSNNLESAEATDGAIRFPDQGTVVHTIKSLVKNVKIVVGDGLVVGRRVLPDDLRMTYIELCLARKALLHRHLPKNIGPTFVAAMIVETSKIAEGIKASSLTSLEDLGMWKKTLASFEFLGMDVAFMGKRVDDLLDLLNAPDHPLEGYKELEQERDRAIRHVRAHESRMLIVKDRLEEMDVQLKEMAETSVNKNHRAAHKLATAPW